MKLRETRCDLEVKDPYYGMFYCDRPEGHEGDCESFELTDLIEADIAEDEPIPEKPRDW